MSEEDWFTRDWPSSMLALLFERPVLRPAASAIPFRDQKYLLFGCAACRRVAGLLDPSGLSVLELAERCALGRAEFAEVRGAADALVMPQPSAKDPRSGARYYAALAVVQVGRYGAGGDVRLTASLVMSASLCDPDRSEALDGYCAGLLRCLFGNPFRPAPPAIDPAWRTDTALQLARTMDESREFGAMPILADALQDAGCDDEAILAHCRDPRGVHARGCWVVDLVLDKS
jgi:hypothetical protein